ncbi:MAG: SDR family NAD(P)-dependent oxidoreductase [Planctomycetaceae bacterium]
MTQDVHSLPFCSLSGRRALVTGASSGIGRAIALEFARAGAELLLHYRANHPGAEQTARECQQLGSAATLLQADLADAAMYPALMDQAWADGPLDIWVNNAGVDLLTGDQARLPYAEKLRLLWDIDVRATVLLGREAAERMSAGRGGVILNIGWDQADRGMEGASGELFATAKNAIMGFTRSLAVSMAPRVRVNCMAPGWIKTAWGEQAREEWQQRVLRETPLARWGTPQDLANLARFLCSDEASYLTGQVINANGGAVR